MVTIDHITNCLIDPADVSVSNALKELRYLSVGLHHLYANVVAEETPLREKYKKWTTTYGDISLGLQQNPVPLLTCFFHWYSVSIINYARLIGFLAGLSSHKFTLLDLEDETKYQKITKYCDAYVHSVRELSAIKCWRNKIAAHFSITAPKKIDNPASLDFSVMPPVAYENGRFRVGVLTFHRTDSTGNTHSGKLPRWSLTETHEALRGRYWN